MRLVTRQCCFTGKKLQDLGGFLRKFWPIKARWWKKHKRPKVWIRWRTKVYERDKYRCVLCGRGNCRIAPHHILPKAMLPKFKYYISNGATLCSRCHRKTFRKELLWVEKIVNKLFGGIDRWRLSRHWQMLKNQRKIGCKENKKYVY